MDKPTRQAVCAVILNSAGGVLAVSRRGELAAWGLPGGKVDEGESLTQALVREVHEETFISLSEELLKPCFTRSEGNFNVHTYLYEGEVNHFQQGDAGPVSWVTWDDLIAGPFGEYNKQVKLACHLPLSRDSVGG